MKKSERRRPHPSDGVPRRPTSERDRIRRLPCLVSRPRRVPYEHSQTVAGRAGIQRGDILAGLGRAGRPQAADVLSQPGGMDELQAFLSLLAASMGTCWPESAIWRSGVMISTGTPALSALETSPESTFLS